MLTSSFVRRLRPGVFAILCFALASLATAATSSTDGLWSDVAEQGIARNSAARQIVPERYRTVRLDRSHFESLIATTPLERAQPVESSPALIQLPLVDGSYATFRVVESPMMEEGLAKRYPGIRTFIGQGVDDPSATLRYDITPKGFHAQILSASGTSYVDPYQPGDLDNYVAYRKQDHKHGETLRCGVTGEAVSKESAATHAMHDAKISSGGTLRTYRLAMAATGEYTAFHGGSKADALAGIVTTMNRVNGIYEREVAVRMILVANTDAVIFTNAGTDPYGNDADDLDFNQGVVDTAIGVGNYDVGHLVGTGGGGVAFLGVICSSSKAGGLTGSGSPVGDGFDVDYVAHEMGHQFAGAHTFNGSGVNCASGNRNGPTAYEPGSGITIQAYAGICGADNLQPNSEDHFHRISLNQLIAHTTDENPGEGGSCGIKTLTGNAIPAVTTAAGFSIPANTPFELAASATDADNDTLTYAWEEFDLGTANTPGVLTDAGNRALFRSYAPTTQPSRVYPSLRYILDNANVPPATAPLPGTASPAFFTGELLPSTNRNMNFRVTVRDNRAGGGGTNEAQTLIDIENGAGPFVVTAPNTAITWTAGSTQTVTWNVANTTAAPVSAANVRITLSLDGGYTWPVELAASEANDGSATLTVPAGVPSTTRARVRIAAVGNIFFDVSNVNFTITGTNTPPVITPGATLTTTQGAPATAPVVVATVTDTPDAAGTLAVAVSDVLQELALQVSNVGGNVNLVATAACSLVAPTAPGTRVYPIRLSVTDSGGASSAAFVNVAVGGNLAPTLGTYTGLTLPRSSGNTVVPTAGPADPNNNYVGISVSPTALPGGGTVSVAANGTVTVATAAGTTFGSYPVRVQAIDSCGAVEIREFTLLVQPTTPILELVSATIVTGNGLIEADECNQMNVVLSNVGIGTATAVSATLSTSTPGIVITQPNSTFADIPAGQSRTTITPFQISSSAGLVCFSDIDLDLQVTWTGGGSPQLDTIELQSGAPVSQNYEFTASTGATLPAAGTLVPGSNTDDAVVNLAVPTGFDFNVYDTAVTGGSILRVSTNGTLQLTASGGSNAWNNGALPNVGAGDAGNLFPESAPVLMPYWDDVFPQIGGGGVFSHPLTGTAPNRRWIVEWRGTMANDGAAAVNTRFAIEFNEGSNVFSYLYVLTSNGANTNGARATIGVQAATTGSTFTQHSFNTASVIPGRRLTAAFPAQVCSSGNLTTATEGGAGDSYTLVLRQAPTSDVTIAVTPDADVTATPASLTFTTLNWNVPQTVTVGAVNDAIVEGAHSGSIAHVASGGGYDGVLVASVLTVLTDNDRASYRFTSATSTAAETADSVNIGAELVFATNGTGTVALESAITVPVTVAAASTATGGGVDYTLGSASIAFPTSGGTQNVTVTLVSTPTVETSETVILDLGPETGGGSGQRAAVASAAPSRHTLTITDGNTIGVQLVESAGDTAVAEGGAGDTYTLVLNSQPTATVTIAVTPDAELTAAPTPLQFTTANWNVPQTVTVTAVDDTDIEGAHTGSISNVASGGGYNGISVPLTVDIADNDNANADLGVTTVKLPGSVTPGNTIRFEVTVNNLSLAADATGANFGFGIAPTVTNISWTCTADAGATCPASGTGFPVHDIGLPRNTGVQYVITATVPPGTAVGTVFTASSTISLDLPAVDPNPANNASSATATVDPMQVFKDGFETP